MMNSEYFEFPISSVIHYDNLDDVYLNALSIGDVDKLKYCLEEGKNNPNDSIILSLREDGILYQGYGSLHYAIQNCEKNIVDVISILIQNGADVNQQQHHGETPLYYAVKKGKYNVVKLLIDNGAKVHNMIGMENPFKIALENGFNDIFYLLIDTNIQNNIETDYNDLLKYAAGFSNEEIMSFLIEKGADVNHEKQYDNPALHTAVLMNKMNNVQFLIQKGAKVNTTNPYTPLHVAAWRNHEDIARFLLEHGANPITIDEYGRTPADIANKSGHNNIIILLSKY